MLEYIRATTNADSVLLITCERVGLRDNSLMLFSSGVDSTTLGRNMLTAGLKFFPPTEEIIEYEFDGRQRLQ